MKVQGFGLVCLLSLFWSISDAAFTPLKISANDLLQSNFDATEVRRELERIGIFQVSDIHMLDVLKQKIFFHAKNCASATRNGEGIGYVQFDDGTERLTLGTVTKEDGRALAFSEEVLLSEPACSEFLELNSEFRDIFDSYMQLVLKRVFALNLESFGGEAKGTFFEGSRFKGDQLEHFHTYRRSSDLSIKEEGFTLDMHVDEGILIGFAPAIYFSGEAALESEGFYVDIPGAGTMQASFSSNSIVFMVGNGYKKYLSEHTGMEFRAVPHAMVQPQGRGERVWYGKMLLPPKDLLLSLEGRTFAQMREMLTGDESLKHKSVAACGDNYVLAERLLQDECGDNEVYCWHQCQPFAIDTCLADGSSVVCGLPSGDSEVTVCGDDIHNQDCRPLCINNDTDATSRNAAATNFCNGFGITMSMAGFIREGKSTETCVIFLFEDLLLDSAGKFVAASLASFTLGVIVEFVSFQRKKLSSESAGEKAISLGSYFGQIFLGYILMLIIMTYSLVLFFSVIAGLTAGNFFFNFEEPIAARADHCCADDSDMH